MGRRSRKRAGFVEDEKFMLIEELKITGQHELAEQLQQKPKKKVNKTHVLVRELPYPQENVDPEREFYKGLYPRIHNSKVQKDWLYENDDELYYFYGMLKFYLNKERINIKTDISFEDFAQLIYNGVRIR